MPAAVGSRSSSQASIMSGHSHHMRERSQSTRSTQPSLTNVSVRSFSDFRAQTSSIKGQSPPSVRRKPLPPNASPQLSVFSPTETTFGDLIDDPRVREPVSGDVSTRASGLATVPHSLGDSRKEGDPQKYPIQNSTGNLSPLRTRARSISHHQSRQSAQQSLVIYPPGLPPPLEQPEDTNGIPPTITHVASGIPPPSKGALPASNAPLLIAQDMSLYQDGLPRSISDNSIGSTLSSQTISPSKRKNSPTNKFSSFFGWKSSPRTGQESPAPSTPFTDRSTSPAGSPVFASKVPLDRSVSAPRLNVPAAIDIHAANGAGGYALNTPCTPFPGNAPDSPSPLDELERELREVSSELANSIKREMDLEDENDRLKGDPSMLMSEMTRRTSDYFSDSGSSAMKASTLETETRIEELERAKRRLEQEKGQIRADYSTKFAGELRRRQEMEQRIGLLERDARESGEVAASGVESSERIRELETFLEEARRRLGQERRSHDNFEDLLAALRAELAQIRNERDNLVEEVIPQLKSRVEGLEQENAEVSNLRYENTRMQQELGNEPNRTRVSSIAGPEGLEWPRSAGLMRSGSVFGGMQSPSLGGVKRTNSLLQRSGSVKGRGAEIGEAKDIEEQRDALHKALKNMIRRHEAQKREHARAIQRLIADRDASSSRPRSRTGFSKKVANLKEDMLALRRRADEALTQKWQCEDNLGGVKMALDRAEQETRSLRSMLGEGGSISSNGLGIKIAGENQDSSMSMIKIIRRSIQLAENERDAARREAGVYRAKAQDLSDDAQADGLHISANRLEQLADHLDECVRKNVDLQERLVYALEKGEMEQSTSTAKVVEMQSRLKGLEDQLLSAQQESENSFAANEEVVKSMDQSHAHQFTRLTVSGPEHTNEAQFMIGGKAPRLDETRSGKAESLEDATKIAVLESKVMSLEKAIVIVDGEMKNVVERVEKSRVEISTLQGERDIASQNMKNFQRAISEEQQRALSLMA
ncbi:hypothetical protein K461DRAFT_309800 [Myriangium duriaei CBS 260.36]|uniref:DUF7603 domain-containing protein n=1 Tax=Myriangium duriaei CBS 260.36 TaxID=1168546 RepID=A0A9P4MPZ4_9PEZI|nr:hypothetical protein K461DRAFT_309800 [Myriangium duriaei CBS 260.36]